DGVVGALTPQCPVGELGGQRSVCGVEPRTLDGSRQEEGGIGVALVEPPQRLVRDAPRIACRPAHEPATGVVLRSPRHQSAAAIAPLPAGWTRSRATGAVAVPTRTRCPWSAISPGRSAGASAS